MNTLGRAGGISANNSSLVMDVVDFVEETLSTDDERRLCDGDDAGVDDRGESG